MHSPTQKSALPPPRLTRLARFALLLGAVPGAGAQAADFPERPITLVVGYSPGGGVDAVARILSKALSATLGQPIVIENKPGAGATIAASDVAHAAPDGYTLLVGDAALVTSPRLIANVPYDVKRDFQPVSILTASPLVLSVNPSRPVKTVPDLAVVAARTPAGYSFSSAGIGSTPHLAGELLKLKTHANFTHVPYRSSGPAMADLVAGQLDFGFSTIAAAGPFIKDNRLRALATTGLARSPHFPDLPTVAETVPGFEVLFFTVLAAPAKTPPKVMRALNDAVHRAWTNPDVLASLDKIGETPSYQALDQSAVFLDKQDKKLGELIEDASIKAN